MNASTLSVYIRGMRLESRSVASFELVAADGAPLPGFAPGAHVDIDIPHGPRRSYSLVERAADGRAYRIAVKREPASRGGSAWLHDAARLGSPLRISAPQGEFRLVEQARDSVFIAGGIGITPLLPMVGRLAQLGRPWRLHYAAASSQDMAFRADLARLAGMGGGSVAEHFSDGSTDRMDVPAIVAAAGPDAHLYCCGPTRMIDAFLDAARGRSPDTVHHERFSATQAAATQGGFAVLLARDGRCLPVPPGMSILDVLLDAGLDVPYSCTQGICGSCRVGVLDGEPDHRDEVLSDAERAANDAVLVCCSGARSARLVLDL